MNNLVDSFDFKLPFIYRYRTDSPYTVDELERSYMYFPNRDQLNDPFDCYPRLLFGTKNPRQIKLMAESIISESDPALPRQIRRKQARNLLKTHDLSEMVERHLLRILSEFGIGCFTMHPVNFMMWSHYANNHRGLCVQYKIDEDPGFFQDIDNVKYVHEFERKEYLPFENETNLKHIFFTKSSIWEKENEFRVLKTKYGKYAIRPNSVKRIIFGMKASDDFKKEIIAKTENIYPGIEYFNSRPMDSAFGLHVQPVSLSKPID